MEFVITTLPGPFGSFGIIKSNLVSSLQQEVTIQDGVANVSGSGRVILLAESGVTDQLEKIEGLLPGEQIVLMAKTDHFITVTKSTHIKMPVNFLLSGYKTIMFISDGEILCELTRSPNT